MLDKISNQLSIHQRILEKKNLIHPEKILSSRTVFNIKDNQCFLNTKSTYCNDFLKGHVTEDWRADENAFFHNRNN